MGVWVFEHPHTHTPTRPAMGGNLLKLRGRARRFSLAALLVYLGVLFLAFGHRCGPAAGESGRVSTDARLPRALPPDDPSAHNCPICAWQRDTFSSPTLPALAPVPLLRSTSV